MRWILPGALTHEGKLRLVLMQPGNEIALVAWDRDVAPLLEYHGHYGSARPGGVTEHVVP